MADRISLIVTDAPPLITLAAADCLDYLLLPGLPVVIPDAVFFEATSSADRLGAKEIFAWYRAHLERVRVEPTVVFQNELILREANEGRGSRDLGERAALEIVRNRAVLPDGEGALLLSDDRDVERMMTTNPSEFVLMTTWDLLRQLEVARRIQSADAVLAAAEAAGRNVPKRSLWANHDPEIADQVAAILGLPRDA